MRWGLLGEASPKQCHVETEPRGWEGGDQSSIITINRLSITFSPLMIIVGQILYLLSHSPPTNILTSWGLSPFYSRYYQGSERLSNLLTITQLLSGRDVRATWLYLSPELTVSLSTALCCLPLPQAAIGDKDLLRLEPLSFTLPDCQLTDDFRLTGAPIQSLFQRGCARQPG